MWLQGWLGNGGRALLVVAALLLLGAQFARANSGSFLNVADAGGRSISVTAEATQDGGCGEECFWYAAIRERHSSLPCAFNRVSNVGVVGSETKPGTVSKTLTFQPFFPRSAKLCLYLVNFGGAPELLAEITYPVPRGYGYQRSTKFHCTDFQSQAAAQYYLYMYPRDPSQLDPDRNGIACDENPCPCDAERIAAEPAEARVTCLKSRSHRRRATAAVRTAERRLRKAANPAAVRRGNQSLKKRKAALRKAKRRERKACRAQRGPD